MQDTDYPHIIFNSLPLKGFNEKGISNPKEVFEQLVAAISSLEKSGCDFIVIPCNSVHAFIEKLRMYSNVPILSIIEETVKSIQKDRHSIVGILGSESTIKLRLYQKQLQRHNIEVITPSLAQHKLITRLIREVMSNQLQPNTILKMFNLARELEEQGAQALILGCTELSLAFSPTQNLSTRVRVYDSLQILVQATIQYASRKREESREASIQAISLLSENKITMP